MDTCKDKKVVILACTYPVRSMDGSSLWLVLPIPLKAWNSWTFVVALQLLRDGFQRLAHPMPPSPSQARGI